MTAAQPDYGTGKKPHILLGDTRSRSNVAMLQKHRWGRIVVEKNPKPFPFERWGFDNAAFGAFLRGMPFPEDAFCRRLDVAMECPIDPYMAVCPDIVCGGMRSLEFSVEWRMKLPGRFPWYLAVQDGMGFDDVSAVMHLFAGVFLGGSDSFKRQAWAWREFAHAHLKKFHYGRAGTLTKLQHAFSVGSDSLDSSFPLWSQERMQRFVWTFEGLGMQAPFEFAEVPA